MIYNDLQGNKVSQFRISREKSTNENDRVVLQKQFALLQISCDILCREKPLSFSLAKMCASGSIKFTSRLSKFVTMFFLVQELPPNETTAKMQGIFNLTLNNAF